jgi:hypothetical protein
LSLSLKLFHQNVAFSLPRLNSDSLVVRLIAESVSWTTQRRTVGLMENNELRRQW